MADRNGSQSVGGASQTASQLSKLRVTQSSSVIPQSATAGERAQVSQSRSDYNSRTMIVTTPLTPITPVAVTPSFFNSLCSADEYLKEELQLAAELGKTLLERNRNLEATIANQQNVLDDKKLEIEYMVRQNADLREVSEARFRIYEGLEASIQDLEKTNRQLNAEKNSDRKKIENLTSTIDSLENRNEELQKNLEEVRSLHLNATKKEKRSIDYREEDNNEKTEREDKVEKMSRQIQEMQKKLSDEAIRREETEMQLASLSQEHHVALQQLCVLREREDSLSRTLQEELYSEGDERRCSKCMSCVDDTSSCVTSYDLSESVEEGGDNSFASDAGQLVRLKNGTYAYGSQDSLASLGHVLSNNSHVSSCVTSPGAEEAGPGNLLSEMDRQYCSLLEKYNGLLDQLNMTREHKQDMVSRDRAEFITLDSDHVYGPAFCSQSCSTCSCSSQSILLRPKSILEEFSEVGSSSGYSEGECRIVNKASQTDIQMNATSFDSCDAHQKTSGNDRTNDQLLDLTSPQNPCDDRFHSAPSHKKIFQEIFSVLKKTADEKSEASDGLEVTSNEDASSTCVESGSVQSFETEPELTAENLENLNKELDEKLSKDAMELINKPSRPLSLDLVSNCSSTRSAKSRRKRRKNKIVVLQDLPCSSDTNVSKTFEPNRETSRGSRQRYHVDESVKENKSFNLCEKHSQQQNNKRSKRSKLRKEAIMNNSEMRNSRQSSESTIVDTPNAKSTPRNRQGKRDKRKTNRDSSAAKKLIQFETSNADLPKMSYPSVEVAKLRKLELSYAEVLKSRTNTKRRY